MPKDYFDELFAERPIVRVKRIVRLKRPTVRAQRRASVPPCAVMRYEDAFVKRAGVHKGSWWSEETYVTGDTVRFGGTKFKATRASWGEQPGRSGAWRRV